MENEPIVNVEPKNDNNQKKSNNKGLVVAIAIICIIILVIGIMLFGVINLKNKKPDVDEGIDKAGPIKEVTDDNVDEIYESVEFDDFVSDISSALGNLITLSVFDNGKLKGITKNVDLLSSINNKQFFVMDYLLKDKNDFDKFTVISSSDNKKVNGLPTDSNVLAYCSYDVFNAQYKKFFNKNFDVDNRTVSYKNNSYDKSLDYVYYSNQKKVFGNRAVSNIVINDSSYDGLTGKYISNLTVIYNDSLASELGVQSDIAQMVYSDINGRVVIESFMIQ